MLIVSNYRLFLAVFYIKTAHFLFNMTDCCSQKWILMHFLHFRDISRHICSVFDSRAVIFHRFFSSLCFVKISSLRLMINLMRVSVITISITTDQCQVLKYAPMSIKHHSLRIYATEMINTWNHVTCGEWCDIQTRMINIFCIFNEWDISRPVYNWQLRSVYIRPHTP